MNFLSRLEHFRNQSFLDIRIATLGYEFQNRTIANEYSTGSDFIFTSRTRSSLRTRTCRDGFWRCEPGRLRSVSAIAARIATSTATGTILDNDTAGVQIVEVGGTEVVEGGATDTYTIVLTSEPTHDVLIALDPDAQLGVDPLGPLTFTPANWHTAQTVTDFINAQVAADQPFFLWYAPFLPHNPFDAPAGLVAEWRAMG